MKKLLSTEEAIQFIASIFLFLLLPYQWWWYFVFLLAPDIGLIGYFINPKVGAYTYNLFHYKAIAAFVAVAGLYQHSDFMIASGIILFGHSCMDRMMGYGLKYEDSFHNTHLGKIGKEK